MKTSPTTTSLEGFNPDSYTGFLFYPFMSTIAIIGRGNVATHLFEAFQGKANITLVNPHTLEELPSSPDVILLCVKDDAIPSIVGKLPSGSYLLAHTSGSVSMDALKGKTPSFGVFYPLQTFTKGDPIDYASIPVFLEASDSEVMTRLEALASLFTSYIRHAGSPERKRLHLASVFACNFSNAMVGIASDILLESGIPFDVLLPLLRRTFAKLETLTPDEAQTGPAIRGDRKIIDSHLDMLGDKPDIAEIYKNISEVLLLKSK